MNNRAKAEQYVNGHTATAVGVVLGTALVPGAASVILLAQEAVAMVYSNGKTAPTPASFVTATTKIIRQPLFDP